MTPSLSAKRNARITAEDGTDKSVNVTVGDGLCVVTFFYG